jgi:hypothetical protein
VTSNLNSEGVRLSAVRDNVNLAKEGAQAHYAANVQNAFSGQMIGQGSTAT